jgi:hypothetical protein
MAARYNCGFFLFFEKTSVSVIIGSEKFLGGNYETFFGTFKKANDNIIACATSYFQ